MENEYKSYRVLKKKNRILMGITLLVVSFYFIMLTSGTWLPNDGGDYQQLAINQSITNTEYNRTITLVRWDYSQKQQRMQVQLRIENMNYDGKNEYAFSAVDKNRGKLNTVSVYQDMEILVLNINKVPKRWSTISLRIGLAEDDPDQSSIFKIYGNSKNINSVDEIENGNKNSYYVLDTKCSIADIENKIEKENQSITRNQEKIKEITNTIDVKTDNLEFLTETEKKEALSVIGQMESEIEVCQDSIKESENAISEYKERIEKLEEKISSYE
ncbi:hypothetical protein [uncultured Fusobacterium sp.]|uniref:hypothetical protein n=1 Tax=uncultured Fusobacterium sp. TaxID=159267 RepID=UPI002596F85E|nr:hypothetical protein [uncultured Fusobacterium sp.]